MTSLESTINGNCFNAIQLFWSDSDKMVYLGPEGFVSYMQNNFSQTDVGTKLQHGDVQIVWSRINNQLPIGDIKIDNLVKDTPGYPFGLVIEHAYVILDEDKVFQKRNPSQAGPFEVIHIEVATKPYHCLSGYEVTSHRRRL